MLVLECSKADYWGPAFATPMLSLVVMFIPVLIALGKLVHSYRNADLPHISILRALSCILTFILLLVCHFPTIQKGIFLPTVSEDEAQYRQGYITSIEDVPFSPRFSISNGTRTYRASIVQVEEDEFFFLSAEGLEIGQEIVISYLPQCNMVLTCQIVEN